MKIACLAFAYLIVLGASIVPAQTAVPTKEPESTGPLIVDVHASPYRRSIVYRTNISPQRFDMRHATIFDMIEFAYALGEQDDDRENAAIVGGPTWIDFDRFDVTARIPSLKPSTFNAGSANPASRSDDPNDQVRPVLQCFLPNHIRHRARAHANRHVDVRRLL